MICSCCGEDREPASVASLLCHDDVRVCRTCAGWLLGRAGGIDVTPILPTRDVATATRFFEAAGFDVEGYDDGFAFVRHHNQSVFDLGRVADLDPVANHTGCYIITADADDWHDRFVRLELDVTDLEDKPWGMHEFTLTDPDGNTIRVGRSTTP